MGKRCRVVCIAAENNAGRCTVCKPLDEAGNEPRGEKMNQDSESHPRRYIYTVPTSIRSTVYT